MAGAYQRPNSLRRMDENHFSHESVRDFAMRIDAPRPIMLGNEDGQELLRFDYA